MKTTLIFLLLSILTLANQNIPPCGKTECDNPTIRDTYMRKSRKQYIIHWIHYNCGLEFSTHETMDLTSLSKAMKYLKRKFKRTGISFKSRYQKIQGTPTDCTTKKYTKHSDVMNTLRAATGFKSDEEAKNHGELVILIGEPEKNEEKKSWISGPTSGVPLWGFVSIEDLTNSPHVITREIARGFGLRSTFENVEVEHNFNCECYEKNREDGDWMGDFCSDTTAAPRNIECVATLNKTVEEDESCGEPRTLWENHFLNLMSDGNCDVESRYFTGQQIRRMRCYDDKFFKHLKNDNEVKRPRSRRVFDADKYAARVLEYLNEYREKKGLDKFKESEPWFMKLKVYAQNKADLGDGVDASDMEVHEIFGDFFKLGAKKGRPMRYAKWLIKTKEEFISKPDLVYAGIGVSSIPNSSKYFYVIVLYENEPFKATFGNKKDDVEGDNDSVTDSP